MESKCVGQLMQLYHDCGESQARISTELILISYSAGYVYSPVTTHPGVSLRLLVYILLKAASHLARAPLLGNLKKPKHWCTAIAHVPSPQASLKSSYFRTFFLST
jgi:hypothetical protein